MAAGRRLGSIAAAMAGGGAPAAEKLDAVAISKKGFASLSERLAGEADPDLQGGFGVLGPQPAKFGPTDHAGAIAHFREFGFVVIDGSFDAAAVRSSVPPLPPTQRNSPPRTQFLATGS